MISSSNFSNFSNENLCPCCPNHAENVDEACEKKIESEIATTGLPYKEIEAIINDHRMVIRMQKEQIEEEYDPPCDCGESSNPKPKTSLSNGPERRPRDDVIFEMTDSRQAADRPQSSLINKTCEKKDDARTITIYPDPGSKQIPQEPRASAKKGSQKKEAEKKDKGQRKKIRSLGKEENPNIFLLRISKKCETGDKKRKFDLEFRAPRPWIQKPEERSWRRDEEEGGEDIKENSVQGLRKESVRERVDGEDGKQKEKKKKSIVKKVKCKSARKKRKSDC